MDSPAGSRLYSDYVFVYGYHKKPHGTMDRKRVEKEEENVSYSLEEFQI